MVFETVNVEQAAAERRERLRAVKAARGLLDAPEDDLSNSSRTRDDDQNDDLKINQIMKF
jgi:hypothetical protein